MIHRDKVRLHKVGNKLLKVKQGRYKQRARSIFHQLLEIIS